MNQQHIHFCWMNTSSSLVFIGAKFESNINKMKPILSMPNKTSSCFFVTSSLKSSSISLIFMKSTFKTQLMNKYYVLNNILFWIIFLTKGSIIN